VDSLLDVTSSRDLENARKSLELALDGNLDHFPVEDIREHVKNAKRIVIVVHNRLKEFYKPEYISDVLHSTEWVTEQLVHVIIELDSKGVVG
jgi:hypothetical protein